MLAYRYGTLRRNALAFLLTAAVYTLWVFFRVPCPLRYFLHIPCPGCGMTHAVVAALHFDLSLAFRYHPMFWSLPVIGALILTGGRPSKSGVVNTTLILLVFSGFVISYIFKLATHFSV